MRTCEHFWAIVRVFKLAKLIRFVTRFWQVWFNCAEAPKIGTSISTLAYHTVWWKKSHALLLTEDPGLQLTEHALKYVSERRYKDDPEANTTAQLSKTASSGQAMVVRESLNSLFREENLEAPSDGEDEDPSHGEYGFQVVDVGPLVRSLATGQQKNKRKNFEPSQNQLNPQEEQDVQENIQQLDELPTFQQMGATGVQCAWCGKWRFLSPHLHIMPESTEPEGDTTFQCHELQWCDGTLVGLSCESYEQEFQPPNPKDSFAKDKTAAETEMKNFFEWWSNTSDTPGEDDDDISVYRDNYWEYLAHIGTLVPEGFADHPINTLRVEDLGK